MKLYKVRVEIEIDMPILAQDPRGAELVAREHAGEEIRNRYLSDLLNVGLVSAIASPKHLPVEWIHDDVLPWLCAEAEIALDDDERDKTALAWARDLEQQNREAERRADLERRQVVIPETESDQ